jgi:GT2 family glycosyltransferase
VAPALSGLQSSLHRDFWVVVDNASTNGAVDTIARGGIPVKVVRAGRNPGFAAGNNLALRG